jgi:tetratricopeptide (TPR) repeat protein/tRNA A-37 threonylcarbamoyl transferase component Bud32
VASGGSLRSATGARKTGISEAALQVGIVLGERYEILEQLGEGGMGTVYKVRDRELDRFVAMKVIRPALDQNVEVLNRFKQELIIARQITHKNVSRIYDMAEADGVKFITMEFVEGRNLASLLRERGKLAPKEAAGIIGQVCRALEAAHAEGVIHRDLKPQNIMVDVHDKVIVMDFGIARSIEMGNMTQTGALLGTPAYMSPEQAKGEKLDARSDLFSLGIIFYELLTGDSPYKADTAMATLYKRTTEHVRPPIELAPEIPKPLSEIAVRCLEIDKDKRYSGATEILNDLETWAGTRLGTRVVLTRPGQLPSSVKWAAAGLVAALFAVGFFLRSRVGTHTAAPHAPVSVLIADFTNDTADSIFDGTLEPMLGVALEGASFVSLYNRGQARKVGAQLQPGASVLDDRLGRLVAMREGVSVVVSGSVTREGNVYRVSVRALDAVTGKAVANDTAKADKKDILVQMGTLAAGIRKALGDTTPESVQLTAAETFSTGSLEAAHEYAVCQTAQLAGKWNETIQYCLKALQLDPDLGRAYAILGAAYHNMGQLQQAKKYYQLAFAKIDRMSEREKYRTRGAYYLMIRDPDKAIEEQLQLVKLYPADNAGIANLALAYFYRRDMPRALEEGQRAAEMHSGNAVQWSNVGLYAMYAGDFDAAIRDQRQVLEKYPSLEYGYIGTALPQLALGRLKDAADTYGRLEKLGPGGASVASIGLADMALYEGRASDAAKLLEKGVREDSANKNADGAARKLATLAEAHLLLGNPKEATRDAESALTQSKETEVMFWGARAYLGAGQDQKALAISRQLGSQLEPDPQAYGKLIEGEVELKHTKAQEALKLFLDSRKIADTWMGRFDSARAYIEAGAFTQAYSELEVCLKRRGEATALFLDESPSYHLFPPVYYYLGRAQEGLKSPAAVASYRAFLTMKEKGAQDPLVADVRGRLTAQ